MLLIVPYAHNFSNGANFHIILLYSLDAKYKQLGMARQLAMPLHMSWSTACVMHTKFKCTKIYFAGIMIDYTKISTYEHFPLYGVCKPVSSHQ